MALLYSSVLWLLAIARCCSEGMEYWFRSGSNHTHGTARPRANCTYVLQLSHCTRALKRAAELGQKSRLLTDVERKVFNLTNKCLF